MTRDRHDQPGRAANRRTANRPYDPQELEGRWRARWEESGLYRADLTLAAGRPKFYNLMEFPYPSAEGLHMGHVSAYGGADANGRFQRMRGFEVFEPMGFDAFGIHTENYALKNDTNPRQLTARTTRRYRAGQLSRIGAMFDWRHAVDTSRPDYYRWTQWLFVQLYRAGLAVRKAAPVNWCPSCRTVLANEQVVDGRCERCATPVGPRELTQWFFKITAYADRLLNNLAELDWPAESKRRQADWIGRREGAELVFAVAGSGAPIPVFTTRPDTVFGATAVVLAPEHPLVARITAPGQRAAVGAYVDRARLTPESARTNVERETTGAFTGAEAINPANGARIPILIADYVLLPHGTGAIMAVPGHDERDHAFARAVGLPIVEVVTGGAGIAAAAYPGTGPLVNSGPFDGLDAEDAKPAIVAWLAARGRARPLVTYRLRDWLISRQRYWGPPIPIVYCPRDGAVPVPEDRLPVLLPAVEQFRPAGTGKSPLAALASFVETTCPTCGGPAERETDVSDTFLDSSWYFLRYPCTAWADRPFDRARIERWLPVDLYVGGREHVVLHHLYARFITMVLHDLGFLPFEEPFRRLRLHGFITLDGAKMSKSNGNVVNPDGYIAEFGADALRTFLLFMGPFDQNNEFCDDGLVGVTRFLEGVWRLVVGPPPAPGPGADMRPLHRVTKRVTEEFERYQYHTAIAALMEGHNWIRANRAVFTTAQRAEALRTLTLLLAPIAPFLGEELWARQGGAYSVHQQAWPAYDPALLAEEGFTLLVQVNGKLRDRLYLPRGISEQDARRRALQSAKVKPQIAGRSVRATFWVPDTLINLVVG